MHAERIAAVVLGALTLALAAGGCAGDDEEPLRVGVLVDCLGIFRNLEDASLAGAELPLLQRGARLHGARPSEGITSARVGDGRVELVRGCTEGGEFTTVIEEARRLVELEGVDAVVGGTWPGDGIVLRDLARRYPDVPFLPALSGPREVTLGAAPPNLYRVVPDVAQSVAGLASYAHDDLGWRRAAVVSDDWEAGWASADAFAAEFCRLGGHVVGRATVDMTGAAEIARLPASVDGVAVLMSPLFGPVEPVRRLVPRFGEPARSIVLGPYLTVDHDVRRALGPLLDGAVGATLVPPTSPQLAAYQRAFAQTFPGLPPAVALSENAVGFRDAVEAVVRAFERAGGRERLQAELAATRDGLLSGQVRLDANRQAVVAGTLARLRRDGTLVPLRRLPPVDQTLGGALPADHEPARSRETC